MCQCKKDVTPLLTHWSYVFLALIHRYHYHHQIRRIHLSHCYHIFPWLCVWDVCYIIFCYLLHIHSGKTGNFFSVLLCSLWWVQMIGYVWSSRSYSFVCTLHHLIIIIVQTYLKTLNLQNACQIYFVECVSKIRHILSVIHYTIRGAVCFQFTHFLVMIERIYIICLIIIIKSEVWTITHCLGLGHETMVCAACLFCILIINCYYYPSLWWNLLIWRHPQTVPVIREEISWDFNIMPLYGTGVLVDQLPWRPGSHTVLDHNHMMKLWYHKWF